MRGGKGRRGKEKQEGGLREREAESLDKDEPRDGGNKIESTTDSELVIELVVVSHEKSKGPDSRTRERAI